MLHNVLYESHCEKPLLALCDEFKRQAEHLKTIDLIEMDDVRAKNILNKIANLERLYGEVGGILIFIENYKDEFEDRLDHITLQYLKLQTETEEKIRMQNKFIKIYEKIIDLHRFQRENGKYLDM